jgi:hypothetical protein
MLLFISPKHWENLEGEVVQRNPLSKLGKELRSPPASHWVSTNLRRGAWQWEARIEQEELSSLQSGAGIGRKMPVS